MGNPLKYKPAVNQVELSFWNPQPELLKVWSIYALYARVQSLNVCDDSGLRTTSYSSRRTPRSVATT